MEKAIYIKAYFSPIGKEVTVKVLTGETKKGFFGGVKQVMREETKWQQTGLSDCRIDGERLANDLQQAIERLSDEGYSIKSITSIISGEYKYQSQEVDGDTISTHGGASYGYGYSYTDGLIILAEKNVQQNKGKEQAKTSKLSNFYRVQLETFKIEYILLNIEKK